MDQELTLDIKEIFQIIRKRLWVILLITFLFTTTSGVISCFVITPTYRATATIIIGNSTKQSGEYQYDIRDVLLFKQLIKTYERIAYSRTVAEKAARNLGQGVTPEEVLSKITVITGTDTQIMEITATSTSNEDAKRTANALSDAFLDEAMRVFPTGNVQIMDRAILPRYPISPKPIRNMAIAFLLGLLLSLGIILLKEYLDNTIKTESDINYLLGIPVIGIIPKYMKK